MELPKMRIGSIIDVSLVDVPGVPVTVIFTAGCNMDCPYCQNAELIPTDSGVELSIQEIVEKASGNLTEGFCITGGEPTIHSDMPELLKNLRDEKPTHINLNTQGSVPRVLELSLPFLDSVWFDIKAPPNRYQQVARTKSDFWSRIEQSIKMLLESDVSFWPRTTYAGGLMSLRDIEGIMRTLNSLGYRGEYVVQNYVESKGVRPSEISRLSKPSLEGLRELQENSPSDISLKLEWR
jgi:pyruvate formate lyase activating enzyme